MRSAGSWVCTHYILYLNYGAMQCNLTIVMATFSIQPMQPVIQPSIHSAPGLHGASVVITGRRQGVVTQSSEALKAEGIKVLGSQVRLSTRHNANASKDVL